MWRGAPSFSESNRAIFITVVALSTGNNLLFWLLARRIFDDAFRPRAWAAVLWGAIVLAQVLNQLLPGPAVLGWVLTLQAPGFALLTVVQTVQTWRGDLVQRRRLLRTFFVVASAVYAACSIAPDLVGTRYDVPDTGNLSRAVSLFAISFVVAGGLLGLARPAVRSKVPRPFEGPDPAQERLLGRLRRLMEEERAYRDETLDVARLAARLSVPDYRLRKLINQQLGHRNFPAFVNGYRIAEARLALADPGQAAVPVLTIALDAGFGSLAPFNRAFKAETGLTPSAYRKARLADRISKTGEP